MTERQRLVDVARGILPADLVLTNGRVFDSRSGELHHTNVAIFGDRIAGLGSYQGIQTLDVRGRIILPGLIDAGAVLEPSHLTLSEFARTASLHGTTTAIFDLRAIAAVLGLNGLATVLDSPGRTPMEVLAAAPLRCGRRWDSAPGGFDTLDPTLLSLPRLVARGGYLDGGALLTSGDALRGTDDMYLPAIVEAAGVRGLDVAGLAALGAAADRSWLCPEEAQEKLEAGLWLLAAEGSYQSTANDLQWLARSATLEQCCLVSGGCSAGDLWQDGHMDAALRRVVRNGVPAAEAVMMVTSRPARLFALRDRGAVLSGWRADLTVVEDMRSFGVNLVLQAGRPVAQQGTSLLPALSQPLPVANTMNAGPIVMAQLAARGHDGPCAVIEYGEDGQTVMARNAAVCTAGQLGADPETRTAKLAVFDRHTSSGRVGLGFVRGLGLERGALCCSFGGPGQNLIVAGMDDASMLGAARAVQASGGGIAIAADGRVVAAVALPFAGLLSPLPIAELSAVLSEADEAAWSLGCEARHPFAALASLADTSRSGLRLTEYGLVDVDTGQLVPLQT